METCSIRAVFSAATDLAELLTMHCTKPDKYGRLVGKCTYLVLEEQLRSSNQLKGEHRIHVIAKETTFNAVSAFLRGQDFVETPGLRRTVVVRYHNQRPILAHYFDWRNGGKTVGHIPV